MMNMDEKQKNTVIVLLGVLFLIIAWFWIYSPMKGKIETLEKENKTLQKKAQQYIDISQNLNNYQEKTENLRAKYDELLNAYPANMSKEDEVMFWANLENAHFGELLVSTLTLGEWEEVLPPQEETTPEVNSDLDENTKETMVALDGTEMIDEAGKQESDTVPQTALHLYKAPVRFNFTATYGGLKGILSDFYLRGNKKNIESLYVAYDGATGNLSGDVGLNLFYMLGTDRTYNQASIPGVSKGVDDVFHTVGGNVNTVLNTTPETEADDENEGEEAEETTE